jgi:hypothetical protein
MVISITNAVLTNTHAVSPELTTGAAAAGAAAGAAATTAAGAAGAAAFAASSAQPFVANVIATPAMSPMTLTLQRIPFIPSLLLCAYQIKRHVFIKRFERLRVVSHIPGQPQINHKKPHLEAKT